MLDDYPVVGRKFTIDANNRFFQARKASTPDIVEQKLGLRRRSGVFNWSRPQRKNAKNSGTCAMHKTQCSLQESASSHSGIISTSRPYTATRRKAKYGSNVEHQGDILNMTYKPAGACTAFTNHVVQSSMNKPAYNFMRVTSKELP